MDSKNLSKEFWSKPDYVGIVGSKCYGTNNEDSDDDKIGFVLPPTEEILSPFHNQEKHFKHSNEDYICYTLSQFINLLFKGGTPQIEALFSPLYTCTPVGQIIRDNRNLFLSKQIYRHIKGFTFAEWRRARVVKLEIAPDKPELADVIETFVGHLSLKRYERDSILDLIQEFRPNLVLKREVPNDDAKLIDRRCSNLYVPKSAAHAIRLLFQGIEILTSGKLTFPRPEEERKLLLLIKSGTQTLEYVTAIYETLINHLDKVYATSTLPDKPDKDKISEVYREIILARISAPPA